ncbi:hypothetical protein D3C81_937030 [compost metagenome]
MSRLGQGSYLLAVRVQNNCITIRRVCHFRYDPLNVLGLIINVRFQNLYWQRNANISGLQLNMSDAAVQIRKRGEWNVYSDLVNT